MQNNVTLTRKFEFSASHRYWNEKWSKDENEKIFGHNTSPYGHGHNYDLYVTVSGPISEETGMIINLSELKKIVNEILLEFDHKYLNLDTPYFKDKIPTTENLALVLFDLIGKKLAGYKSLILKRIRLYVTQDAYADVWQDT
ncbi:MAG: 6-carboxytetrahydropterin synthase [Calditrichaceae bacterium]|nr:6-carboxytetrahydropterin synthase [Calditrichaceae bacterium]